VGLDLARVPRIHGANRAAFVPNVVGGRVAFPAQLEKIYHERINSKERLMALKSAIAATASAKLVAARGHAVAEGTSLPFVVTDDLKGLKKAAEFRDFLKKVSLWSDVERAKGGIKERSGRERRGAGAGSSQVHTRGLRRAQAFAQAGFEELHRRRFR
jgi:large subunit ribosomal protein L4e